MSGNLDYRIFPVTSFQQNCTVLWCTHTRHAVLIDPGGEAEFILAQLTELQVKLKYIFLTHGHLDHIGASAVIAEQFTLPIWGPHAGDAFLFQTQFIREQCHSFGFPPIREFIPARWLQGGELIHFGEVSLEVLHCPGHTPGHLVFFAPQARLAQVGDVLFRGSIGRTDLTGGNTAQLLDSIHNRLFSLGDDVQFIPGHGPLSTFGRERRTNPFVMTRHSAY